MMPRNYQLTPIKVNRKDHFRRPGYGEHNDASTHIIFFYPFTSFKNMLKGGLERFLTF